MSENSDKYGHLKEPTIHTLDGQLKYSLCRNGAFHPKRANPGDAGIDFFVPRHTWENGVCELKPGARVNIPSGIKVDVPAGWALIFMNKSDPALIKTERLNKDF